MILLAGAPKLKEGGSITFIGGGNGTKPASNAHQAGAINAATEGLARGLAKDLSPTRVNVVSPGIINTALWEQVAFCLHHCVSIFIRSLDVDSDIFFADDHIQAFSTMHHTLHCSCMHFKICGPWCSLKDLMGCRLTDNLKALVITFPCRMSDITDSHALTAWTSM